MKPSTSHLPARMPTRFNELNSLYPLRPINDRIDLKNAGEVIDRLAVLGHRTRDQNDYLATLILLSEAYEAEEIADAMDRDKSSGLDALKYLMNGRGMKQADLARLLSLGASAVSMILSGDRPITADHARKLAKHFGVNGGVFL
jgi:antitoxin component HigA of HigAB toxin-antitoxin module